MAMVNQVANLVWSMFGQPQIDDFGTKVLDESEQMQEKERDEKWVWRKQAVDLVLVAKKKQIAALADLAFQQGVLLGNAEEARENYLRALRLISQVRYPFNQDSELLNNSPILDQLSDLLALLVAGVNSPDDLESSLTIIKVSEIRNLIFYRAWQAMGSPNGIHSDFGRVSYLNDLSIREEYHLKAEQRIEIVRAIRDGILDQSTLAHEDSVM